MATHDYVIANGTGSAVRSDLNNALAAIVSNNSGSSEPSTKYAYQWWADTTTGQLKLRNSANNGWVTIFELDGTMLMEDGTVSAPGLAFASDLNSGFFSGGADKINFATGGVERLEIGSSEVVFNDGSNDVDFRVESNGNTHTLFVDGGNDVVGIGTSSPNQRLTVGAGSGAEAIVIQSGSGNTGELRFTDTGSSGYQGAVIYNHPSSFMEFMVNSSSRLRIDSSGNVGINMTPSGSSKLQVAGSMRFGGSGSASDSTNPIIYRVSGSDSLAFASGNSERMRIDSSGRLLVGLSSSLGDQLLQVSGSTDATAEIFLANSGASTGNVSTLTFAPANNVMGSRIICTAEEDFSTGANRTARLEFHTRKDGTIAERMRITSGGSVLYGTTSDTRIQANRSIVATVGANGDLAINHSTSNGSGDVYMAFGYNGSQIGSITQNGTTAVAFNTSSDYRLKENVVDIADGITRVKQLAPKRFNFIADDTTTVDGFLAHEAQTVVPEAITGTHNEVDADGNAVMQGIDQSKLVPLLTAALQEAIAEIETLKTKVAALEAG